ncbi:voltage-dependent calcium channel subunit alpha-2/delta-3 isoform X2 [Anabrus simplex]|uniref:voltage-dependent calcium channel subunit alpha-2/delta-3 isoform X2 n=1 Tax=Anabrus simplex TaxID=316456 RepID=UPI0035A33ACA
MAYRVITLVTLLYVTVLIVLLSPSEAQDPHTIDQWAEEFGDELWDLGLKVSKVQELKKNYKRLNARVQIKDGRKLLNSINDNVGRMLKWRIDAIQCVRAAAEEIAEEFEYDGCEDCGFHSAKFSAVNGIVPEDVPEKLPKGFKYIPMDLAPDTQFYNIPINKSYSSVHVPTNVYDVATHVLEHILWSKKLDDVFIQNYESDPSLSWQYFGGSSGFLRNYPAMPWNQDPDEYDCRNRFWYIEAATCSKDIVILLDTTGSMKGLRLNIAKLTVNNILDTLGSNDFINVLNFSHVTQEVVPCFKDILVQATIENINTIKTNVNNITVEGYANFSRAFVDAFKLLERHRELRGCNSETGVQCNQAIMLVTDSVQDNITEVFEKYNKFNNGSTIPVRVFTYLVGSEVTKVMEIMWMACLNRGYYVHIESLEEVREQVFKYIPVVARPLVLQGIVHPIVWTHAYADIRDPKLGKWLWDVMESGTEQMKRLSDHFHNKEQHFSQREEDNRYAQAIFKAYREPDKLRFQEYKLVTSVSVPAFNRKLTYEFDNYTHFPDLLGVIGTDVPLEDIKKLTYPYRIGVNGYAFIVTNNGYVLLHPDLRPVSRGVLKDNYNSIDLTEVELLDDTRYPRELSPEILELREAMVNHTEGEILGLRMKFHYDDMRRVGIETRDYYFAPLKNTPFSIGIALPQNYGYTWLRVSDEIKKSQMRGRSISDFFEGKWKVHPRWVYCKYFHESQHPFNSPEMEVQHFLEKMSSEDFKWEDQYRKDYDEYEFEDGNLEEDGYIEMVKIYNESKSCRKEKRNVDEYYCDKDLMNLLVFDAKITNPSFHDEKWSIENNDDNDLVRMYNTTVRFLATQSGLTRWQNLLDIQDNDTREFGDLHSDAIEEPWYVSAILQHKIDPDSFAFSVPFDAGTRDDSVVTASHAVYPRDGGLEAPAVVIGLQLQHSALHSRFMSITSKMNCQGCQDSCASDQLDCFVLDHNGYVVISENHNDTGQFFGEIEGAGAVMEAMMNADIYRKIRMYDYQALCFDEIPKTASAADILWTPVYQLSLLINWVFTEVVWLLFESNLHQLWYGFWVSASPISLFDSPVVVEAEAGIGDALNETEIIHEPCDQKTNIYLLQQEAFLTETYCHPGTGPNTCSRPFCMKRIPHSNLILVVVDTMHETCYRKLYSSPKQLLYNVSQHPCQKLLLNYLPRRRLTGCFTSHPVENTQHQCGDCTHFSLSITVLIISWIVLMTGYKMHS